MSKSHLNRRQFLAATAAGLAAASGVRASAAPPGSRKKGFCTVTRDDGKWLQKISAVNAQWFYSWGSAKPDGVPDGVEYCPMVWGGGEHFVRKKCAAIAEQIAQSRVHCAMGFNEPDQHDQSNLSVEKSLEWWPMLMELEVPLVSPGCVHPDREWMQSFMSEADRRDYRVDYISVHSYAGPSVDGLMNRLESVYKMFGRPLWITEFAVGDWHAKSVAENQHSPEQIAKFMRGLLPELDKAKFIDRYAWFSAAPTSATLGTSALFDEHGELTNLGRVYAEYPCT